MQYLLTEDEYKSLLNQQRERTKEELANLQALCTMVADHMPVKWGWPEYSPLGKRIPETPKPWGCVITKKKNGHEWYCDKCPVLKQCPASKRFSK